MGVPIEQLHIEDKDIAQVHDMPTIPKNHHNSKLKTLVHFLYYIKKSYLFFVLYFTNMPYGIAITTTLLWSNSFFRVISLFY